MTALDLGGKAFSRKFLNQRRGQERGNDNLTFIRLERIHAFMNFRKRLDTTLEQVADVKAFETVRRRK